MSVSVVTVNAKEDPHDPYKHFFNETWGNMPEERAKGKEEGKVGVLVVKYCEPA